MSKHDCTTPTRPKLTAERLRELLHYDPETGIFTRLKTGRGVTAIGAVAGSLDSYGYLQMGVEGRNYKAHRLAWLYVYGSWPKDQIDHINRDRADNRIENLREVTNKQNQQNRSTNSDNTSGHTGVSWYKPYNKWRAEIKHNQKSIHLGLFENLEEALSARKAAQKLYWADTQ